MLYSVIKYGKISMSTALATYDNVSPILILIFGELNLLHVPSLTLHTVIWWYPGLTAIICIYSFLFAHSTLSDQTLAVRGT